MRLIDADKLKESNRTHITGNVIVFENDIDSAKTVEAIPIEWIRNWEEENWELECNYGIDAMIEEWEEENG